MPNANADRCIVTNYDATSSPNPKIYLRSIGNRNVFFDYDATNNGGTFENGFDKSKYNGIYLLPVLIDNDKIECDNYNPQSTYSAGTFVKYNNIIWKATIDCSEGMIPSNYSIAWEKINGASIISTVRSGEEIIWRPMTKEDVNVSKRITTTSETTMATTSVSSVSKNDAKLVESSSFKEYVYYPCSVVDSEFTDFVIRIDLYAYDDVNVPRVKNLRAIAVV